MLVQQEQSFCNLQLCQHPVCWKTMRQSLLYAQKELIQKNKVFKCDKKVSDDVLPCISILNLGESCFKKPLAFNKHGDTSTRVSRCDDDIIPRFHWEPINRESLVEITPAPANTPLQSSHRFAEIKMLSSENETKWQHKNINHQDRIQNNPYTCAKIDVKLSLQANNTNRAYTWASAQKNRESSSQSPLPRLESTLCHSSRINLPENVSTHQSQNPLFALRFKKQMKLNSPGKMKDHFLRGKPKSLPNSSMQWERSSKWLERSQKLIGQQSFVLISSRKTTKDEDYENTYTPRLNLEREHLKQHPPSMCAPVPPEHVKLTKSAMATISDAKHEERTLPRPFHYTRNPPDISLCPLPRMVSATSQTDANDSENSEIVFEQSATVLECSSINWNPQPQEANLQNILPTSNGKDKPLTPDVAHWPQDLTPSQAAQISTHKPNQTSPRVCQTVEKSDVSRDESSPAPPPPSPDLLMTNVPNRKRS